MTGKRRRGRDEVTPPPPPTPAPTAPEPPAPVPAPEPAASAPEPAASVPEPPAPVRPPVETVTLPALTRRQLRIDRRKRRRKAGVAGIAGAAVLALIIIAAIAFGVHKAVTHHHHATVARSQTTVLLQIQGPDRTALGSVLLAHDPAAGGSGVELLVPSQLITDVCGVGQVTFGQTLASTNGQQVSRQAVSAALGGITVDGSWVLSTTLFARLVDAVGGVVVDVDTNVLSRGPNGAAVLDIPQGTHQRLTGAKAVEYATYRASTTEDAAAQLARLSDVVDAMIRALPPTATGPTGVISVLGQLGRGGASTLGASRLATLLIALAHDDTRPGGVLPIGLPTTLIDTGGTPSYSVDTAKTTQLVEDHFASSLPAVRPGPKISVELRNGVGTPGLVATACPRLAAAGLVYAGQGNAATFNNPTSEVQIASDSASDRAAGAKVARALRLPASDVRTAAVGQNQADVVVVLGRDYRP